MQFSTITITLLAGTAIQPVLAGGFIKGIFGKRSLEVRGVENREHANWARDITADFEKCLGTAKESISVTKEGTASFNIKAADGSWPASCVKAASTYQKTPQVDGQLVTNKDGSYTIHPNTKEVAVLSKLVKANAPAPAAGTKAATGVKAVKAVKGPK